MGVWPFAVFIAGKSYGYLYEFLSGYSFAPAYGVVAAVVIICGVVLWSMDGKLSGLVEEDDDEKNIKQYGTTDASALALNSGDVDAVVVSTSSAEPMLTTFPNLTILPQDEFDLDAEGKYSTNVIGFPLGDEYKSLIEVANKVINEAKANGDLEKWANEAQEKSVNAID